MNTRSQPIIIGSSSAPSSSLSSATVHSHACDLKRNKRNCAFTCLRVKTQCGEYLSRMLAHSIESSRRRTINDVYSDSPGRKKRDSRGVLSATANLATTTSRSSTCCSYTRCHSWMQNTQHSGVYLLGARAILLTHAVVRLSLPKHEPLEK